jgi:hypothetical protein
VPPPQEQPAPRRRARRRQDGRRRGPGPAHLSSGEVPEVLEPRPTSSRSTWARCSPARSFRGDFEERLKAVIKRLKRTTPSDPVHRRDPHHRRRRRDLGRLDGRLEPAQAGARLGSCAASARRPTRTTASLRARPGARPPLPEDRRRRAVGRGRSRSSRACARATRSTTASRTPTPRSPPPPSCRPSTSTTAPARQGDRRDRRGGRRADAGSLPAEASARRRSAPPTIEASSRDGAHPAERGVDRRPRRWQTSSATLKAVIFGQDRRSTTSAAIKLARAGLGHPEKPIGSSCSRADRRRQDRARQAARRPSASSSSASTCPSTWRSTRSRASSARRPATSASTRAASSPTRPQAPALRAAPRRDREGPPRPLQRPAPGHGPRDLTDNNGRKADFRNVVLIMTTNAGAREIDPRRARRDRGTNRPWPQLLRAVASAGTA